MTREALLVLLLAVWCGTVAAWMRGISLQKSVLKGPVFSRLATVLRSSASEGAPYDTPNSSDFHIHSSGLSFLEELDELSFGEALSAVCGHSNVTDVSLLFPGTEARPPKFAPTINRFVIANPLEFFADERMVNFFQIDLQAVENDYKQAGNDLSALAKYLPVVYLADVHSELGTLGFQLNLREPNAIVELIHPSLRALRQRPLYRGGAGERGSAQYMIHRFAGFPENRAFKTLSKSVTAKDAVFDNNAFHIFYSPAAAMANELCLTGDAKPEDFKFFNWATVWLPEQLEMETRNRFWICVQAPVSLLFADDDRPNAPLYKRVLCSLPKGSFPLGRRTSAKPLTSSPLPPKESSADTSAVSSASKASSFGEGSQPGSESTVTKTAATTKSPYRNFFG